MYRTPLIVTFLALSVVCFGRASGQIVRGEAVEEGSERPLRGAFIVLLDEQGRRQGATLVDSAGDFSLQAPGPGRYTLRMELIGSQSTVSSPFDLNAGEVLNHRIVAPFAPIELEGIRASGSARCDTPREIGAQTSLLWEEARKALSIAEWVRTDRGVPFQTLLYERERDLLDLEIKKQSARFRSGYGRTPFYSATAQDLATDGYVRLLPEEVIQYFGLDAPTLLSDDFLDTHCFRVRDPKRGEDKLVGLSFEPIPAHHAPDITGVLWLDRRISELRYLEFQFTEHLRAEPIPPSPFGGRVEFRRLVNGAWAVDRWWLRMPQFPETGLRNTWGRVAGPTRGERDVLIEAREAGMQIFEEGGVVRFLVEPGPGTDGPAGVQGIVYDSTMARPLVGATVFFTDGRHFTQTDADGRFRMDHVPEGTHHIAFLHPYADSLRLPVSPQPVDLISGERASVALSIPLGPGCANPLGSVDQGRLAGMIFDGASGDPVGQALVTLEWETRRTPNRGLQPRESTVHTGDGGNFFFCGFPVGEVRLSVRNADGGAALDLEVSGLRLVQQDLVIR